MGTGGPETFPDSELLAETLEQIESGVVVYEGDGTIEYTNSRCCELLGISRSALVGSDISAVFTSFADEQGEQQWRSHDPGEKRTVSTRLRPADTDGLIPVDLEIRCVRIDGVDHCIATFIDVTELKERGTELEQYKRIVENLPVGAYRTTPGPKGEFRLVNQGLVDILNAESKATLRNTPVSAMYHEESERQAFSDRLLEQRKLEGVELQLETFDGEPIRCEASAVAVEEDEETVFELVLQDITSRKERERELERYREAVEQAGHAVVITDRDGKIEYVNPAFEETTGYSRSEAVGETPALLNSGRQDEQFYEDLWETILDDDIWEAELINRRKSGELFYTRHTIAPITDEAGRVRNFVGIQIDTTRQKLREKRLSELERILRHNIRNKVTAIVGHAEALKHRSDDADPAVSQIISQAESLAATSRKSTKLRKLLDRDAERTPRCEADSLLAELVEHFRERYPAAAFSLEAEPATVAIDPDACRTVFREIIENAVVHSDRETPAVTIRTVPTTGGPGHVRFEVADNGPGISDQDRTAVEVGEERSLAHGSGIGLSHIHWIVTEYGGDVSIRDNEPRGAVVTVSLPIVEEV